MTGDRERRPGIDRQSLVVGGWVLWVAGVIAASFWALIWTSCALDTDAHWGPKGPQEVLFALVVAYAPLGALLLAAAVAVRWLRRTRTGGSTGAPPEPGDRDRGGPER